jgi:hypothetical protein
MAIATRRRTGNKTPEITCEQGVAINHEHCHGHCHDPRRDRMSLAGDGHGSM